MTDLSIVLPEFPVQAYTNLIPSLEKNHVTTTDLVTLNVNDIAKRARLPLLPLKKLCDNVLKALQEPYTVRNQQEETDDLKSLSSLRRNGRELVERWGFISTLDGNIDAALGGGIPTGCIAEITGESGAGKTQFLLTLLLSCQLPAPHGLSRNALYISTESALPTTRLSQMLENNPVLKSYHPQPTLDGIISIVTPDLETQDHIIRFQVPVAIEKYNVGLIVLDSVAANYRAEFDRPGAARNGANMAKRSAELTQLGSLLRSFAQAHNIAVVVSNQVSDRFTSAPIQPYRYTQSQSLDDNNNSPYLASQASPLANRSGKAPYQPIPQSSMPMSSYPQESDTTCSVMKLDHQQRWFTGWGDDANRFSFTDPNFQMMPQKTPALGLVWTSQLAARIALIKTPVYGFGMPLNADEEAIERGEQSLTRWKRYCKIVFAAWAPPSGDGIDGSVEFEISSEGIRCVADQVNKDNVKGEEGDGGKPEK